MKVDNLTQLGKLKAPCQNNLLHMSLIRFVSGNFAKRSSGGNFGRLNFME